MAACDDIANPNDSPCLQSLANNTHSSLKSEWGQSLSEKSRSLSVSGQRRSLIDHKQISREQSAPVSPPSVPQHCMAESDESLLYIDSSCNTLDKLAAKKLPRTLHLSSGC